MKKETMFTIAIVGVAAVATGALITSYQTNNTLKNLLDNMDKLSDGIEVDIPEKIATMAVNKAAEKAAEKVTNAAAVAVKTDIHETVAEAVKTAVGEVQPIIQEDLENQLSLVDISDIKKDVVKKAAGIVAENIIDNVTIPGFISKSNSTADIIKSCADAGMDSWDIKRILETVDS